MSLAIGSFLGATAASGISHLAIDTAQHFRGLLTEGTAAAHEKLSNSVDDLKGLADQVRSLLSENGIDSEFEITVGDSSIEVTGEQAQEISNALSRAEGLLSKLTNFLGAVQESPLASTQSVLRISASEALIEADEENA